MFLSDNGKVATCFTPKAPYPIPKDYIALPKLQHRETEEETPELELEATECARSSPPHCVHLVRTPSDTENELPEKVCEYVPFKTSVVLTNVSSPDPLSEFTLSAAENETLSSLLLQTLRCYSVQLPMEDDIGTVVLQHTTSMNTVFKGYRRNAEGTKGYAETQKLFRAAGDQIVTIDGTHCVHVPFEQVLQLLHHPTTPGQTHKRILLCSFSSKNKKKANIA